MRPELRDAGHKLAAIDEYLSRTTTEGRARVAAAMRRLEARIGSLLGPAENHGPATVGRDRQFDDVSKDQRSDFRRMAEHPEVVGEVIAKSTDEEPASRRKVTEAIKTKTAKPEESKPEKPRRAPLPDVAMKAGWEFRKSVERLERVFEAAKVGVLASRDALLMPVNVRRREYSPSTPSTAIGQCQASSQLH